MPEMNPKEVEKHLKGVHYPANKADLVNQARQEGANEHIIEALEHLPDQTFNQPTDVARAIEQERR